MGFGQILIQIIQPVAKLGKGLGLEKFIGWLGPRVNTTPDFAWLGKIFPYVERIHLSCKFQFDRNTSKVRFVIKVCSIMVIYKDVWGCVCPEILGEDLKMNQQKGLVFLLNLLPSTSLIYYYFSPTMEKSPRFEKRHRHSDCIFVLGGICLSQKVWRKIQIIHEVDLRMIF